MNRLQRRQIQSCYTFSRCFSRQVGLSILIISGIVVFALSAVAVRDLLWMVLTADVLGAAALLPLIGFMLGYAMSVICQSSPQ